MKRIYITSVFIILLFPLQGSAQQRAFGISTNVEFNNVENNLSAPVLMSGFFYQFPIGKRVAISSIFSFGQNRYISRVLETRISEINIVTTQYYESLITWDQFIKIYFLNKSKEKKSKLYWGMGYSIRSPQTQRGEIKSTRIEDFPIYFKSQDFPRQQKLNFAFGADYFWDHKFFLSMEAGFQMPIFEADKSNYPILAGGDMLFLNFKVGIHLYKAVFYPRQNREKIHIKDLEIKN